MGIRRWFVWPPLVLALVLAQSYFWVPTYDEQARGNPGRLEEFIHASIGDASILNPILSADRPARRSTVSCSKGSSTGTRTCAFAAAWPRAGPCRRRPTQRRRARAAAGCTGARPGGSGRAAAHRHRRGRKRRRRRPRARRSRTSWRWRWSPRAPSTCPAAPGAGSRPSEVSVRVSAPPRVKLTLREVDQDLFPRLSEILGPDALLRVRPARTSSTTPDAPGTRAAGARGRAPARNRAQPRDRVPAPARPDLPRRTPGDRPRRHVHLRRDHGPPQPVPAGLGLRAGEDGPGDRPAHRADRLQTPLLPGRGDLDDRPAARAPAGR